MYHTSLYKKYSMRQRYRAVGWAQHVLLLLSFLQMYLSVQRGSHKLQYHSMYSNVFDHSNLSQYRCSTQWVKDTEQQLVWRTISKKCLLPPLSLSLSPSLFNLSADLKLALISIACQSLLLYYHVLMNISTHPSTMAFCFFFFFFREDAENPRLKICHICV